MIIRRSTAARPSGVVENFNGSRVDLIEADTLQCGHCGHHFKITKGKVWGTCHGCRKPVCDNPSCLCGCYPFEQRLEDYEKGKIPILL